MSDTAERPNSNRSPSLGNPSDAELAAAARQGDKRAFVEIVARYQAMVCGITLGILGDFASSEDAGQEAFLLAWRRIEDLREPARLRAWLGQIARNTALAHLRRRRPCETLPDDATFADLSRSPDEAAASEEEVTLVRECLARLPEPYRLVLVLYYREGQSVRQTAEALGLGEDAVKQRLARGRVMLREQVSSRIESALIRTAPSALFTLAIASAIGALAPPVAVAGSVFASATATASAPASTSHAAFPFLDTLLTAMSASKIATPAVLCLVAAFCIPIGYQIHPRPAVPRPDARFDASAATSVAVDSHASSRPPESAIVAEWRALHDRHGTNAAAMPQLFAAISDLPDSFRRRAFGTALISEWVEIDAAGGLAFFLEPGRSTSHRKSFFLEWLGKDPGAAVDTLLNSPSRKNGQETARDCLPDIARLAPDRVPEIASKLPGPEGYWERQVQDAFGLLAERDLAAARQAAERVEGENRAQALEGVARTWGKTGFPEAVAWARVLPEGTDRDEVIRAALIGRASVDPIGALESVGMVPAGGRYAHFASTTGARVLQEAAKSDFDRTARWLAEHPGQFGHDDLHGLAQTVTERLHTDPAAFLSARSDDGSLAALLPALSSALLNEGGGQRQLVWDWLRTQPRTPSTEALGLRVLESAAYQDPSLAIRLAADLPAGTEGDRSMAQVARCLLSGVGGLDRYASLHAQAPERLRQALMQSAFDDYLRGDTIDDPSRWVSRLSELPEGSRNQARISLSRAWGQLDPENAIAWASSLPAESTRSEAVAAAVGAWAAKDARGAADWLNSLPTGIGRDQGSASFAAAIASSYPQEAWDWTLSIQEPALRIQAAAGTLKGVARRDAALARRWIDQGPFTPADKGQLHAAVTDAIHKRK